jgi:hypothetical protein
MEGKIRETLDSFSLGILFLIILTVSLIFVLDKILFLESSFEEGLGKFISPIFLILIFISTYVCFLVLTRARKKEEE